MKLFWKLHSHAPYLKLQKQIHKQGTLSMEYDFRVKSVLNMFPSHPNDSIRTPVL
jgi:hypothetical protein